MAGKKNTRSIAWHERCGYKRIGESVARWTEVDGRVLKVGAAYREKDVPVRQGGYEDYGASDTRRFKGGRGRGRR